MTKVTTKTTNARIRKAARAAVATRPTGDREKLVEKFLATLPIGDREEFVDHLVRALKANKPPKWRTAGQQLAGWRLLAEIFVWCAVFAIKGVKGGIASKDPSR